MTTWQAADFSDQRDVPFLGSVDPGRMVDAAGMLLDAFRAPAWHDDAVCREHPEVDFFPERGRPTEPAKAVCAGCLVRQECLEWSLKQDASLHGIWGGLSQQGRRRIRIDTAGKATRPLAA